MQIIRYSAAHQPIWDDFIRKSANGCFLHQRNFMEYHAHRFVDHSLLFFDQEVLMACLPAHVTNNCLYSHLGLTYAGIIASAKAESRQIFLQALKDYASEHQFDKLELRLPPKYYDPALEQHSQDLLEAGFQTQDQTLDLFVDLTTNWIPSPKKTAGYRNGKFNVLKFTVSQDLSEFWNQLLIPKLQERHQARPVHSLQEMELLLSRFPDQILQYYVEVHGEKVGGITLFDFGKILKVQYAAASDMGFRHNAMDFLYQEIIQDARDMGKEFVDMGIVNNPDGSINEGLLHFKKQLGARTTPVSTASLHLRL